MNQGVRNERSGKRKALCRNHGEKGAIVLQRQSDAAAFFFDRQILVESDLRVLSFNRYHFPKRVGFASALVFIERALLQGE